MHIGSVKVDNPTVLAPLAGITNLPLRLLAKEAGCGLVCSEMISSNGLVHQSEKTYRLMDSAPQEKPLSVQIFGADPGIMADAAQIVAAAGADIIDINFGCSVRKVLKTGSGAALMKTPGLAREVLHAIRKAVGIPVTIKIRSGWDRSGTQALEIAGIAEDCGINAIAVHPRTAAQGFRGRADWEIIAAVKKQVGIPVIGNGDIQTPEDALDMFTRTGCDAVMIGRAAIGNPWIFRGIRVLLENRGPYTQPGLEQRFESMLRYLRSSVIYFGEKHACYMMRSRLSWFVKGLRNSSHFRESIKRISTEKQAVDLIRSYQQSLADRTP
ncbi:MAG: tRNA dihydrouridine synthase DusB [Desulfobacterales bacterium]|nr:tRNA dihydrouridine synthase DusB [Desulfobacterales bacterium]